MASILEAGTIIVSVRSEASSKAHGRTDASEARELARSLSVLLPAILLPRLVRRARTRNPSRHVGRDITKAASAVVGLAAYEKRRWGLRRQSEAIQEVKRWMTASDIVEAFKLALSRAKSARIHNRHQARERLKEELMRLQPSLLGRAYDLISSVDLSPETFPAMTAYQVAATHLDQRWTRVRDWCYALARLRRLLERARLSSSKSLFAKRALLALPSRVGRGAFLQRLALIENSYEQDQAALEVLGLLPFSER